MHAASAPAYVCIYSCFLVVSLFRKIWQNLDFTVFLSQLHFSIVFSTLEKIGMILGKIEKIGLILVKVEKHEVILGKVEKNWGDFEKN